MKEKRIFAEGCEYTTEDKDGLNNNVIVCGGTGSGKTMSVLEPILLETNESDVIVTASKSRVAEQYKPLFEERGYTIYDLDLAHPDKSTACFDPMFAAGVDFEEYNFLAKAMTHLTPKTQNDHFWDDAAANLLYVEMALARMLFPCRERMCVYMADVLDLHKSLEIRENKDTLSSVTTSFDDFFYRLNRIYRVMDTTNYKKLQEVTKAWKAFRELPPVTARCVYGYLGTHLGDLFSPSLVSMLNRMRERGREAWDSMVEPFMFSHDDDRRCVLFITTPPSDSSMNRFVKLLYSYYFRSLFRIAGLKPDGRLPRPLTILCDDFAVGGKIPDFPELISVFREMGISAVLLLQSESQLASMYGENGATTIINNCDTYVYMGGMDLMTARNISLRVDKPLEEVLSLPRVNCT